ncbi:hypothetical protein SAMN04488032_10286 [Pacificibacter marinus]|uniref:Uncharacterized protein n=1 Tax=Pacificibacter marinus TaxID=658057 RepID=A0A1Y5RVT0_9RHOB|nr:hypothetical protein SAMN04488032_10286 [Pacificibacter marinus]SLN26336.1 hypothetical protein PAM7971_01002 [Pacificibacter marinus]
MSMYSFDVLAAWLRSLCWLEFIRMTLRAVLPVVCKSAKERPAPNIRSQPKIGWFITAKAMTFARLLRLVTVMAIKSRGYRYECDAQRQLKCFVPR